MQPGFYVCGLFLGLEHVEGKDRETGESYARDYVGVAMGTNAYRVYLGKHEAENFAGLSMGDPVLISCRTSVSSRGTVTFSAGKFVK